MSKKNHTVNFGGLDREPVTILNDTLYYNLIQDLSIRHKISDRAERQFTQLLLLDGGQEKLAGKTHGEKIDRRICVGTIVQALNSPSYETTKFKHIYPR